MHAPCTQLGGWSLGGGHGPFANALGLGVDNILEAEVVTADGSLLVANSTDNADLLWALRGGGGSTWGVVVSFTLRAHPVPEHGITSSILTFGGNMCEQNGSALNASVDLVLQWQLSLSANFSGLVFMTPTASPSALRERDCGATWEVLVDYVFMGGTNNLEFASKWRELVDAVTLTNHVTVSSNSVVGYPDQWARAVDYGALSSHGFRRIQLLIINSLRTLTVDALVAAP